MSFFLSYHGSRPGETGVMSELIHDAAGVFKPHFGASRFRLPPWFCPAGGGATMVGPAGVHFSRFGCDGVLDEALERGEMSCSLVWFIFIWYAGSRAMRFVPWDVGYFAESVI